MRLLLAALAIGLTGCTSHELKPGENGKWYNLDGHTRCIDSRHLDGIYERDCITTFDR